MGKSIAGVTVVTIAFMLLAVVVTTLEPGTKPAFATFRGFNGDLAFAARDPYDWQIYRMKTDGDDLRNLTNNPNSDSSPDWSPDGTKIAFMRVFDVDPLPFNTEIFVMNADGTDETRLTFSDREDGYPSWSPDGTKIAFAKFVDPFILDDTDSSGFTKSQVEHLEPSQEIFVMNADGTDQIRLTNNNVLDTTPSWSPDGTKIAFTRETNGDSFDIWIMNADGTDQTRLTTIGSNYSPDWSPSGTKIAFTRERGDDLADIWIMNADGTDQTRLTFHNDGDYSPSWSPDGIKIAFISFRDIEPKAEIYLMNADGTDQTNISNSPEIGELGVDWQTIPGCLIATAAFGSELSPQVQFLRDFRDNHILSTNIGISFMNIFNAWYYSFSPYVADYEREQSWFQQIVRTAIYPLLGILLVSEKAFSLTDGEYGAISAGLIAIAMVGAIYLSPLALSIKQVRKNRFNYTVAATVMALLFISVLVSIISGNQAAIVTTSLLFVLAVLSISAILTARMIVRQIALLNSARKTVWTKQRV